MREETRVSPLWLIPMCAALSLLLLWAAESVGWFALLFFLPLALCAAPLAAERQWVGLVFAVLLTAAVVLFLPVRHYVWLAYVCVLAPYVPVRTALQRMRNQKAAVLLSVGIVAAWTAGVLALLFFLGLFPPAWLNALRAVLIGFAFLVFIFLLDAVAQLFLKFYRNRLRRFLLPRA